MTKETILALLKSLTNPEVEKHLSVGASAIDYKQLFKVLAPSLITILEDTILKEKSILEDRILEEKLRLESAILKEKSRDVVYGHSAPRTATGVSTIRWPSGEVVNYEGVFTSSDLRGRCIP